MDIIHIINVDIHKQDHCNDNDNDNNNDDRKIDHFKWGADCTCNRKPASSRLDHSRANKS
jgi:hypothetical protein